VPFVRLRMERRKAVRNAQTQPPYRVPTMTEIRALPWNGYSVISTFSGGGGSSCGYKMAGFRVLLASEFIEGARETYTANFPETPVDPRDIRKVDPEEWLERLELAPGDLDILDGSPPCASFSTSGKREAGWGKVKTYSETAQRTDDLFFEYARMLRALRPKVMIAENVAGLVKGTAKGYFQKIMRELRSCGYNVRAQVLDAQWLGVPQQRQRLIFVGVREDLGLPPEFPKPFPYRYTVKDALEGLSDPKNPEEKGVGIDRYAIGAEWRRLKIGEKSDKYLNLIKAHPGKPSPCVTQTGATASAASVTHPWECRKFSIPELKRISSFPDDFVLRGSYAQNYERLGRSVPPVMMSQVATVTRDKVLARIV
jgi:DNA (cytosine-5)-methyltransferase 1